MPIYTALSTLGANADAFFPLRLYSPAYTSFNGMTDGWIELLDALKASVLTREALLPKELAMVANLRKAAEEALQVSEIRR